MRKSAAKSQIEVEAAKLQLEYCQVRSPIAGEVVELKAFAGQRADVGTPLATILDTSEVLVQARIPSDRLERRPGRNAIRPVKSRWRPFAATHFRTKSFRLRGGWLSEQTEAQTGDVPIKLCVPNPKGILRAGMTVQVEMHESPVEGIAIPEVAVTVNEEGDHMVTVIRDGKAVPTKIVTSTAGGTRSARRQMDSST